MDQSNSTFESIFHAALERPPAQRVSFVDKACEGDHSMRDQLHALLQSHAKNESGEFILDRAISAGTVDFQPGVAENEGDTIGRYRLLELIGEGGMGRVYMAEQTEGVRRRVALKIIKLGMDTRQVIARFEAERQALALFDHPSITRVLDAGATETGRPFFVMELVKGTCITDYVLANNLPLTERLRIFVEVCRAVQHAHLKGVIHRDLKPSNILVTQFDGIPVPKVIDFGIAKAIGHASLTDKTLFTRYASMIGTPQYMSPEQAEMTGLDIDTRADIYSLGVILYELITGSTPLEARKLKQLNPLALYETLRDANIETPSTRAKRLLESTLDSATSTSSAARNSPAQTISPERIQGELDWIVMKSISRDRRRRYESASDLAADVERYLAGDPVEAAPPSRYYALRTTLKKHRSLVLTTLLVGSALLASTILSGYLAVTNHRTNNELASSNQTLQNTIAELTDARRQLQKESENKRYRSAIKLALNKFEMEVFKECEKTFLTQLSSRLRDAKSSNEAVQFQMPEGLDDTFSFVSTFAMPCQAGNELELLKLSQIGLLEDSVSLIREQLEERSNAELTVNATEMIEPLNVALDGFDMTYAESSPAQVMTFPCSPESKVGFADDSDEMIVIPFEFAPTLESVRHRFYRILVKEYDAEFGESNSRVAPALNILANFLLDQGKLDEAESNLRHSLLIADEDDKQVAQKLLQIVKSRRER